VKISAKLILVGVITFTLGYFSSNFAYSAGSSPNIGVVDVQKVVQNYSKVNKLKTEQKSKLDDLKKFVEDAKAQVAKEPNADKKKTLEEGFNKELNKRKKAIDENYSKQLEIINKDIMTVINKSAKTHQMDIVLTKNSVLYGGKEITDDIIKALK